MVATTIPGLHAAATEAGDGAAVISFFGAVNSNTTHLANTSLNLNLALPPNPPSSSPYPIIRPAALPSGPLTLILDHLDAPSPLPDLDKALLLAVALSGALVIPLRQSDLNRPESSVLAPVFAAIERSLALRAARVAPPVPARKNLVLVVTEYDQVECSEPDLLAFVSDFLSSTYDSFDLPTGFAATQHSDLFDLQVCLVPSEKINPSGYAEGVERLSVALRNTNRDYADAGMTPESLMEIVQRIQHMHVDDSTDDLPGELELGATFACNAVMATVLDKYRTTAKQWKGTVETGRIIRNFGKEGDALVERTLQFFDKDATVHKSTKAFVRKREELKAALLSDTYSLFAKQILKLREVAYQVFRGKLARIRINDQVEKNVRGAVKEAESYFVENAESLRSNLGGWRFDNERHELVNNMRNDATERLQLARLQGNYVPHMRSPIAFAFHTLLLAPFGRDSRFAHPHAEEMQQSFDPDKVKKAGLMRSRPQQRKYKFAVKDRDEVGEKMVDMFSNLFEDAPAP